MKLELCKTLEDIVDVYNDASTTPEEKEELYKMLCNKIWNCGNERKLETKSYDFKVKHPAVTKNKELFELFDKYKHIEYQSYKSSSKRVTWDYLIRQKINNIYSTNFDKRIVTAPGYIEAITKPRSLYYLFVNGHSLTVDEVKRQIEESINAARGYEDENRIIKQELPWDDYKELVNGYLLRILNNCKSVDEYSDDDTKLNKYESSPDNAYVKYFCNSLYFYFSNYGYESAGLYVPHVYPDGSKSYLARTCKKCGKLYKVTGKNQKYCIACSGYQKKGDKTVRCIGCGYYMLIPGNSRAVRCYECSKEYRSEINREYYEKRKFKTS